MRLLLVVLLALAAPWTKRVARHAQWVDVRQVPSRYLPISNAHLVGPYNILIADNGYYCAVDDWDYVSAGDGDLFT